MLSLRNKCIKKVLAVVFGTKIRAAPTKDSLHRPMGPTWVGRGDPTSNISLDAWLQRAVYTSLQCIVSPLAFGRLPDTSDLGPK